MTATNSERSFLNEASFSCVAVKSPLCRDGADDVALRVNGEQHVMQSCALFAIQRTLGRRMALGRRDRGDHVALSKRFRFGRAKLREGFRAQCVGSDAV